MNQKKQLVFSLLLGEMYEVESDEIKNLTKFQIPLTSRPSSSCKKCFGRMYTDYNTSTRLFSLCGKCANKYVDSTLVASNYLTVDTIKNA